MKPPEIARPQVIVQQVPEKKKSSGCAMAFLLLILLVFLGVILGIQKTPAPGDGAGADTATPKPLTADECARMVKVTQWSWTKSEFGIMEADFTISNGAPVDVKDITIRCEHSGPSGTVMDSNTRTIYEVIRAGEVRRFENFKMGFINSQATRSSAMIKSVALTN